MSAPEDVRVGLYEAAPCGMLSTEANGLIVRVNRTLCSWLECPAEELVGRRRFQDLLTVGCKIFHQTHWMPLLQMQGSVAEVQLELTQRGGRVLPVLVNAIVQTSDGAVQHHLAVFMSQDRRKYERELLLARRRAEELLESERQAQEALAEVLRAQEQEAQQRALLAEQLIGIVSHDLRTPLNAVLLGAGLLAASDVSAGQARTVARISSAANRANRLIADLLDFTQARVGSGLRTQLAELDLHLLVSDCIDELRLAWPGRMIDHAEHGPGQGHGDHDRLVQVVTNLANNALTYGAPDRPITINSMGEDEALVIEVHNHGAPIPESILPHIFEPLRRGEQQVKLGSRSVGLGLYIVQQIAQAHGGSVEVHSDAARGTRFQVRIPRLASSH